MLVPGIVPIYMGEGGDHILLRAIEEEPENGETQTLDSTAGEQGQAPEAACQGCANQGQGEEDKWGT